MEKGRADVTVPEQTQTVHRTKDLVQHMMFIRPDLRIPFRLLGVTDDASRSWGPVEHKELNFLFKNFVPEQLYILGLYGQLQTVVVISIPHHVPISGPFAPMSVYIQGEQSTIDGCGLLETLKNVNGMFVQKDFLPEPFCRKIVYVKGWGEENMGDAGMVRPYCEGFAFSEIYSGMWTMDPPWVLGGKSRQKCGFRTIMNNIFLDIREEVKGLALTIAEEHAGK